MAVPLQTHTDTLTQCWKVVMVINDSRWDWSLKQHFTQIIIQKQECRGRVCVGLSVWAAELSLSFWQTRWMSHNYNDREMIGGVEGEVEEEKQGCVCMCPCVSYLRAHIPALWVCNGWKQVSLSNQTEPRLREKKHKCSWLLSNIAVNSTFTQHTRLYMFY